MFEVRRSCAGCNRYPTRSDVEVECVEVGVK